MVNRACLEVDGVVWEASQEIAVALAQASCKRDLGQLVINALHRMVHCDVGSILTAVPGEEWLLAGGVGDNHLVEQNYWRYVAELSNVELRQLTGSFALATNVFEPSRRDRLAVFREFLRPNGLHEAAVTNWAVDGGLCVIGLGRGEASYSDQDLARLNAVLPLVRAAMRVGHCLGRSETDEYPGAGSGGPWGLTRSQERTMSLVLRGLTNKEIAGLLGTSPNTVRNTLAEVFFKVGVSRRSELAFIVRLAATEPEPRRAQDQLRHHRQLVSVVATALRPP